MATYEQVTYNSPDGALVGNTSTDKVGFWGVTPAVQQSLSLGAAAVTTTLLVASNTSTAFAFSTSTQGNDVITQLNAAIVDLAAIKTALSTVGIVL